MENISLIIEAEQKARNYIKEARSKSDAIKKEVEKTGGELIEKAKVEADEAVRNEEQEYGLKIKALRVQSEEEKQEFTQSINTNFEDNKEKIISRFWGNFVNSLKE